MITKYNIGEFEWVDVLAPQESDLESISKEYDIQYALLADSIEASHLPKYEHINELVFLMFRIFDKTSDNNSDTISKLTEKISVFYRNNYIITIHRDEIDFIAKMIKKNSCKNISDLLLYFINNSVSSFEKKINNILSTIEIIENHLFGNRKSKNVLQDLYRIKKQIYVIDKVLDLNIDLVQSILDETSLNKTLLQDIKETNDKLQFRTNNIIENINNIINTYLAIESNKANEIMKMLTVVTLFFLPASFLVGIYGMNFKIPELGLRYGYGYFWIFLILMETVIFFITKKKKWM